MAFFFLNVLCGRAALRCLSGVQKRADRFFAFDKICLEALPFLDI